MIETLNDVVEDLADKAGVYGAHDDDDDDACKGLIQCRVCWTSNILDRIWAAVRIEQTLERGRDSK